MNPALLRSLLFVRGLVPVATTLAAVVLAAVPLGIPYYSAVAPFFPLIAVFYWSVYRPELLAAVTVFMAGVLYDILIGGPVGLVALILLAVHGLAVSQRRILLGQSFWVEWAGFWLVAAGAAVAGWVLSCGFQFALLPPWPFAIQAALTATLYPAGSWLLGRAARAARPIGAVA